MWRIEEGGQLMEIYKEARLSEDGIYRYTLTRTPNDVCTTPHRKRINFIMLNPSTADASIDDPTIRRCMGFAWGWGFEQLTVTNIFALRSTDPANLYTHDDPIGDDNDNTLLIEACSAAKVIMAWGTHGAFKGRGKTVQTLLKGVPLFHLGLTKEGHPKHPLYLAKSTAPVEFSAN